MDCNDDQSNTHENNALELAGIKDSTLHHIMATESFKIPVMQDLKIIPMLKLMKGFRHAGAQLNLVDNIIKILIEEAQSGRLDVGSLSSHHTAMTRISRLFPTLPRPI